MSSFPKRLRRLASRVASRSARARKRDRLTKTHACRVESLESRLLLTNGIMQVNYFPTWDGGIIKSTDPASIAYHAPSGHLFIADSEIDEMPTYFNNANIFEVSLKGDQVFATYNTVPGLPGVQGSANDEPTGITYNTFDGYWYVSSDDARAIYRYDASFNYITRVKTNQGLVNLSDPEGITSDPSGNIYVANGHGGGLGCWIIVYNANLEFQAKYDITAYVADAEGIAYDPLRQHLFVVSSPDKKIYEFSLNATLIASYDLSGFSPAPKTPQGLTFAPTSDPNDAPSALALYIADGGKDNVADGGIYEAVLLNTPPVLTTVDTLTGASEDTPFTISYSALAAAADESDANSDPISFRIESVTSGALTKNGTAVTPGATLLAAGESLVWTPAANANGVLPAFTVRASDGQTLSLTPVTVNVEVQAVNDVPTLVSPIADQITSQVAAYSFTFAAGTFSDADGDALTYAATKADGSALPAWLSFDAASRTFSGNPGAAETRTVTIKVTATDTGGASATDEFQLVINDPPVLASVSSLTGAQEDQAYSISYAALAAAADESDANGDPISFRIESVTNGILTKGGAAVTPGVTLLEPGESLIWIPAANANGLLGAFAVRAWDGMTPSATAVPVLVDVLPVNDTPSFVKGPDQAINEDAGPQTVNGWATAVSAGPADEAGQTLTFLVTADNGALFASPPSIDATGKLTYTPAANASGSATVTVRLKDNGGGADASAPQTFLITINAINDSPSFVKGPDQTVSEDSGAQVVAGWATSISAGPADESAQSLTFQVSTNNDALFSVLPSIDPGGTLRYTPAPNASGSATVTVVLKDNGGTALGGVDSSAPQTFTITVSAINDPPSFVKGADQTVNEDSGAQIVTGWAASISAGPADESGQTLTFQVSTNNNALFSVLPSIDAGGTLRYTPAQDAAGTATVTVSLKDNGGTIGGGADTSAEQTFTITVTPVNDPPRTVNPIADQTTSQGAIFNFTFAANTFEDIEGDPITYAATKADGAALPSWLSFTAATRTFSGTPANADVGTVTVRVTATDGSGSGSDDFLLTVLNVNDPPTLQNVDTLVGALEDQAFTITYAALAAAADENDIDGDAIVFRIESLTSGTLTKAGTAVSPGVTLLGPEELLVWTPPANANGVSGAFAISAWDGLVASAAVAVNVQVQPINDIPSFLKGADQTVAEDIGPQTVAGWATGLSAGPPDESSQTLSFLVTTDNSGLFASGPSIDSTGKLTFTPAANAVGTATVTVRLQDSGGIAGGGVDTSAPQTFMITVTPVNDPPSFVKGADQTAAENGGLQTVAGWATSILAGPADESGQTLSFLVSTDNSALFASGPSIDSSGNLSYTPTPNAVGTATVTVRLQDNGGTAGGGVDTSAPQTFTITVVPVNDPPSFVKGADQTAAEDGGPQTVSGWATNISPGPADESGQTLSFLVTADDAALFASGPSIDSSGTLTYTPAPNAVGTATVTVRLQDNGGTALGGVDTSAPQTFTITLTPVNDPPSFLKGADQTVAEDSPAQTVAGWATSMFPGPADESGQTLSFLVTTDNSALFTNGPSIDAGGNLTYTPAANVVGTATVTVRLQDNGGIAGGGVDTSSPQTFTITVIPVNDPPSFLKGADQTAAEDSPAQTVAGWATNLSRGPADESGQTISFLVTADNSALFANGPSIDSSGTLTYTPASNAVGTATVTVRLQDNGGTALGGVDTSAPQTFTITVTPVNDPPSFLKGADQTAAEDSPAQTVAGWATNLSPGPADESGQTLSFLVTADNSALFANGPSIDAGGNLTYTPAPDAVGTATVTVRLQDNGGIADGGVDTSIPQMFTITLTPINDPPSFLKGSDQTVAEDGGDQTVAGWATSISAGPADESAQILTFLVTTDNAALFASGPAVDSSGKLTYTPAPNAVGMATVTVRLQDNGGTALGGVDTSAPQTFTITVIPVNDPPSFLKGADQTVAEDSPAQTVAGWATNISPGPPDESGQTFTFMATTTNDALFAELPSIDTAGTLRYTPAPNVFGSAIVTVVLRDNGGMALGGIDTSAEQTFTITVTAVNDAPQLLYPIDDLTTSQGALFRYTFPPDTFYDLEGDPLTYTATRSDGSPLPPWLSFNAATRTFSGTPANEDVGTISIRVNATDGKASAFDVFLLTVLNVNDPPTLTQVNTFSGAEEDRGFVISYTALAAAADEDDIDGNLVSFRVESVTSGSLTKDGLPVVAGSTLLDFGESLVWTPPANANGVLGAFAISAWDGVVASAPPVPVNIAVQAVNDSPLFVKGMDLVIDEDAPPQAVDNWATDRSPGPADEAGQTFMFLVTTSNDAKFAALPAIDPSGRLTYASAPNAFGSVTVSVKLRDSGGTAFGGVDTSAEQTFTITMNPINDPPTLGNVNTLTGAEEDREFVISHAALTAAADEMDVDDNTLCFRVESVTSGTLTKNGTEAIAGVTLLGPGESLNWLPAANANGVLEAFTIQAWDGLSVSATAVAVNVDVQSVNDAPSFVKGADHIVSEDAGAQTVTGWATGMVAGPADEASQTLAFLVTTDNAALFAVAPAVDAAGKLTYTPAPDAFGSATVTVRLQDDGGTDRGGADVSVAQTFTITVNAVNDPPTLGSVSNLTGAEEDRSFAITYEALATAADDADVEGDTIAFRIESVSSGTLTKDGVAVVAGATLVGPGESLSWLPAADANGLLEAFTVRAWDGQAASAATVGVSVVVQAINDAPSFTKGTDHSTGEDAGAQTVDGWGTGMLPGPADEASQSLSFLVTTDNDVLFAVLPAIDSTGKLTYIPASDVSGSATVTVRLRDDGGVLNGGADTSAPQTFTITVNPVNDVPSFTKGADQTIDEDSGTQTVDGWATDLSTGPSDEAGQALSFLVTTDNDALFADLPAVDSAGKLTYTPAASAFGSATVTVRLSDDGGIFYGGVDTSAPQTFTITVNSVNDAPSFTKGADQTVNEDAGEQAVTGWATTILSGPANEATQSLSFLVTTDNPALFAVAPAVDAAGTLTYTSAPNTWGSATVTVQLQDNGGTDRGGADISAPQTFKITVNAVNDAPSFTKGADQAVYEDTGAQTVIGWATDILPGPADEAGQTLTFVVSTSNDALFAVPPSINASSGTLTYTPAVNAFGSATVTVRLRDNAGTALGGVDVSAPQTFTISVNPVNDVPSFVKGANQTVAEDAGPQTVGGWATAISPGPANEVGQTFTFLITTDNDALFAVRPSVDASGTLTYTPAANANGSATVTVRLQDSGGTVAGGVDTSAAQTFTITVTPVNDPPTISSVSTLAGAKEDTAFVISFDALAAAANEADVEGSALVFRIESVTSGTLTKGGMAVTPGATLLGPGGTLVWTPPVDANGVLDAFTIRAWDGQAISTIAAPVRVLVQTVNDAPSFTKGANQVVGEDAGPQSVVGWATGVSPGPADEAGQGLQFLVSTSNDSLFATLPSIDPLTRALSYTPAPNAHGSATVTVRLQDDGGTTDGGVNLSTSQTFTITVNPVNDAPTLSSVNSLTGAVEDMAFAISYAALADAANEADVDGDAVVFRIESVTSGALTKGGTAVIPGATLLLPGQSLIWTRPANTYGLLDVFTIRAWDGQVASATAVPVPVSVQPVNDAPSFLKGADQMVLEDAGSQTVNGWATSITPGPSNEAGQPLAFLVTTNNNALFAALPSIDSAGTLTYTPAADAFGSAMVTVRLQDGGGTAFGGVDTSAPQTFTITVNGVQDPPALSHIDTLSGAKEDTPLEISYATLAAAADESDADGDAITFHIDSVGNGTLTKQGTPVVPGTTLLAAGESLVWTPATNANGVLEAFTVRAWDGQAASAAAVPVPVDVQPINDPPTFTTGPNQVVNEDTGVHVVDAWLTNATAGPSDEAGQTFVFLVTTNNDSLFAALPSINPLDGQLTYTLAPNAVGSAMVTVRSRDSGGTADGGVDTSNPQTFTITVDGVEDTPTLSQVDPFTGAFEDTAFAISYDALAAAADEADVDGDSLAFRIESVSGGTLMLDTNPVQPGVSLLTPGKSLFWTPVANANGLLDAFTIRAWDGHEASMTVVPVRVGVLPVNDPPAFTKGVNPSADEDAAAQTVSAWATAISPGPSDETGQTLTFLVTTDNDGLFAVLPSIDPSTGNLTYTPAPDAFGSATVTVRLRDNGGTADGGVDTSAQETFTIMIRGVNDPPVVANPITERRTSQGAPFSFTFAADTFRDIDGDPLTYLSAQADGSALPAWLSFDGPSRTFSGTPGQADVGTITVRLTASDSSGSSANLQFRITTTDRNDPPTLSSVSSLAGATEDVAYAIDYVTLANAADEADMDGDSLAFRIESVVNGTLTKGGAAVVPGVTLLVAGESLLWTAAANANGVVQAFTIRAWDGQAASASAVPVGVAVSAVNDPPSFAKGANLEVDEDAAAQTVGGWATAIFAGPADEAGQTLTFLVTTGNSSLFAVPPSIDPANGDLSYTPAANAFGSATVTVRLQDNGGTAGGGADTSAPQTFTITVHAVNDPPALVHAIADQSASQGTAFSFTFAADAFQDVDGGPLTYSATRPDGSALPAWLNFDAAARTFSGTPASQADVGTINIRVTVSDSRGGSAADEFGLTVSNTNDAPAISRVDALAGASEDTAYAISYTDLAAAADEADVDGDPIAFRVESVVSGTLTKGGAAVVPGVTLLAAGESLLWTPAANANGSLEASTIRAWDGQAASASAVPIIVEVSAVNDSPSFLKGGDQVTQEDAGARTVSGWAAAVSAGPGDEAGQMLTFLVNTDNPGLFAVLPAIDSASGNLMYTPAADASGSATITVRLQDNGSTAGGGVDTSAPQTFTITVNAVNDSPTLGQVNTLAGASEGMEYAISYADLAAAADEADVDGDALAFRIESVVSGTLTRGGAAVVPGTTLLAAGESLIWTPAAHANGVLEAFTIRAWDGQATSASAVTVLVDVAAMNAPPVAVPAGPYHAGFASSLVLDGSNSYDPDTGSGESIVRYRWDLGDDGQWDYEGAQVTLPWAALSSLPREVSIPVRLEVTDSEGLAASATTDLTIAAADLLNSVDFLVRSSQELSSEGRWYQLSPRYDGLLTIEALQENAQLDLFDSSLAPLGSSALVDGRQRLDHTVSTGGTFYFRLRGETGAADLRVANLVHHEGTTVTVHGTSGSDQVRFDISSGEMSIKDVAYSFAGAATVAFDGSGGEDHVHLVGSGESDVAVLRPHSATLRGNGYAIAATHIASSTFEGGGGKDIARLYGTARADAITLADQAPGSATPAIATLTGGGAAISAAAEVVYASGGGGRDTADVYRSLSVVEEETAQGYESFWKRARMWGSGYYGELRGLREVAAHANESPVSAVLVESASRNSTDAGSLSSPALETNAALADAVIGRAAGSPADDLPLESLAELLWLEQQQDRTKDSRTAEVNAVDQAFTYWE